MGHLNKQAILNKRAARAIKAYKLYMRRGNALAKRGGHSLALRIAITKGLTLAMQAHARRAGGWPSPAFSPLSRGLYYAIS